jgi:hypothetical protein
MVTVPEETPVTIPVEEPTVATAVLLLIQVPPNVVSLNVAVDPEQIPETPAIAPGEGLIVTVALTEQPPDEVKVTVAVPWATPLTIPDAEPIVAILVPDILHVPPGSDKALVEPAHKDKIPVIAGGGGVMVTFLVMVPVHPFTSVADRVTGYVPVRL